MAVEVPSRKCIHTHTHTHTHIHTYTHTHTHTHAHTHTHTHTHTHANTHTHTRERLISPMGQLYIFCLYIGLGSPPLTPHQPFTLVWAERHSRPLAGGLYNVSITQRDGALREGGGEGRLNNFVARVETNGSTHYLPLVSGHTHTYTQTCVYVHTHTHTHTHIHHIHTHIHINTWTQTHIHTLTQMTRQSG